MCGRANVRVINHIYSTPCGLLLPERRHSLQIFPNPVPVQGHPQQPADYHAAIPLLRVPLREKGVSAQVIIWIDVGTSWQYSWMLGAPER